MTLIVNAIYSTSFYKICILNLTMYRLHTQADQNCKAGFILPPSPAPANQSGFDFASKNDCASYINTNVQYNASSLAFTSIS